MREESRMIDLRLRACEPIGALARAEGDRAAARGWRGGRLRRLHGSLSGCRGLQAVSHQDVVGEGEPAPGGVDLGQAAPGETGEAPLPKASIDALAHGSALARAVERRVRKTGGRTLKTKGWPKPLK